MAAESESAFLDAHRKALTCFWDQVKSRVIDWKSQYEWRGVTGQAALDERTRLERSLRRDLATQGFLSKATFDSVMKWGFGTDSGCAEEEINRTTAIAFQHLKQNRLAEAAHELVKLSKVGISRASKILALSDQNELGIYDSRSAHGLSDLVDSAGRRIVLIPRGRVITLDKGTNEEYCAAFERYTWVLRYLRRLTGTDDPLRTAFTRIADLEIALFMRSRSGNMELKNRPEAIPQHLRSIAQRDEESLFWTLGPGQKAKPFWVIYDGLSTTVLTGKKKTSKSLTPDQVSACLSHFGYEWFPLSNSKTPEDRDPRGLGEYFARNFGSSVFASHFAAVWVHEGRLEKDFKGTWCFRVRRT